MTATTIPQSATLLIGLSRKTLKVESMKQHTMAAIPNRKFISYPGMVFKSLLILAESNKLLGKSKLIKVKLATVEVC